MRKTNVHSTLSDVARMAGVGLATASRVVNGGTNVSPTTFKKVESAIRELGYIPNEAARILKGGRTKTIGLLIPSIADSFFANCTEAAGAVARLHDSLLIVGVSNNLPDTEMSSLDVLMRHRPDGLLIAPSDPASERLALFMRNSSMPIVTFDRPLVGGGCASVITDNFVAARNATIHLIEHGYKRILCFGGEAELYTIKERLRGYRHAMEEAGLPLLIDTALSDDAASTERSLKSHLASRKPPHAVFTLKNSATIAVFQALQRLGVSVPSSVALLGFDDFDLASTLRPSISVVQQPIEDVGRKAAELLFAQLGRIHGGHRSSKPKYEPMVLSNRLLVRNSCGCKVRPVGAHG
jgi:LacI family transcriptional regulator